MGDAPQIAGNGIGRYRGNMNLTNKPGVLFQPNVQNRLKAGIDLIVNAVRPTLGPHPRLTVIQRTVNDMPELLDNGGIIARRIVEIQDRDANMGAMLTRQMLWQLHETVGDGTATAAVMFQKIYNDGLHVLANGGNKMMLRRYLEEGLQLVVKRLEAQIQPLEGQAQLTQMAQTICYDPDLSKLLGEIFDIIGEYGRFEVHSGQGRELEREYVEGVYWDAGLISRVFLPEDAPRQVEFENAAVLISDFDIKDAEDLVPILEELMHNGTNHLIIVASRLSEAVIGYLYRLNHTSGRLKIAAVKTPLSLPSDLTDMAIFTGGQALTTASGRSLGTVQLADLGRVRRARADMNHFGIIGGKGDAPLWRRHIAALQTYHAQVKEPSERRRLQERIGRLLGGSAILHVGGMTEPEIEARKAQSERTGSALRSAIGCGFVPGGGVALLECQSALKGCFEDSDPLEKRAAFRILAFALEEPLRTILTNAGMDLEAWIGPVRQSGSGMGVDVRTQKLTGMVAAGILDSAGVVKAALQSAVTTAALALTLDVLVHRRNPPQSNTP